MNSIKEKIISIFHLSKPGRNEEGKEKTNQDNFIIREKIANLDLFNIYAVLDGHGAYGHFISKKVVDLFHSEIQKNKDLNTVVDESEAYEMLTKNNFEIIKKMFEKVDNELSKSDLDISLSGTTCNMIIQVGKKIICANLGDSRSIMVCSKKNTIIELSRDHKPDIPEEAKRIKEKGGEIRQFQDEDGEFLGPLRVWKRGEQCPGIGMTRSFGDSIGTSIGVFSEPEIKECDINKTKFIVLASDGVWEFLDNEKTTKIILPFYEKLDAEGACNELYKQAFDCWKKEDDVVDDITIIMLFFSKK